MQSVPWVMQTLCSELLKNQKIGTAEQTGQRTRQERNWSTLENDRRQMDTEKARNSNGPDPGPPLPFE